MRHSSIKAIHRLSVLCYSLLALALILPDTASAQMGGKGRKDRVPEYFGEYDLNSNGQLERDEWVGRGNFDRLDDNRDGILDMGEFRKMYAPGAGKVLLEKPMLPANPPLMDPSVEQDCLSEEEQNPADRCAISRGRKCRDGDELAIRRGLQPTGMSPVFPAAALCPGVDETFATDYTKKTGRGMHGGIDIPVDFGTPMLAAADGTVVGVFSGEHNARGMAVVLRHSPEDTGLPMWTYTEYGHLDAMPELVIGQRVRMGEAIGPTGNSGTNPGAPGSQVNNRRPAIHFAVYYSKSRRFSSIRDYLIPDNAHWMDSHAFYRRHGPYDTPAMIALAEADKATAIPVLYADGQTEPANTRRIWPYACARAKP
ncbi:MAG: peptidoglycan DD-metalloendopeptidase family protein [Azonexus sp.]|nr:peptidoglycan DD-metalloendopeptidase family protein [Azonexus sp.]